MVNYWLFKSEPDQFSIDSLSGLPGQRAVWDGVRNYQARNFLRDNIRCGDRAFFYHSSCPQPAIAGIIDIVSAAYPDPAQFDQNSDYYDPRASAAQPRWYCVDVQLAESFAGPVKLAMIRQSEALSDMVLLQQGRLSIQPVTAKQWKAVLAMANRITE